MNPNKIPSMPHEEQQGDNVHREEQQQQQKSRSAVQHESNLPNGTPRHPGDGSNGRSSTQMHNGRHSTRGGRGKDKTQSSQ